MKCAEMLATAQVKVGDSGTDASRVQVCDPVGIDHMENRPWLGVNET